MKPPPMFKGKENPPVPRNSKPCNMCKSDFQTQVESRSCFIQGQRGDTTAAVQESERQDWGLALGGGSQLCLQVESTRDPAACLAFASRSGSSLTSIIQAENSEFPPAGPARHKGTERFMLRLPSARFA